jgi:hypothetical protein
MPYPFLAYDIHQDYIMQVLQRKFGRAAGIELGEVIHIEDLNPDQLQRFHGTHARMETPLEDEGQTQAFDPSSIAVAGTVMVAYKIHGR